MTESIKQEIINNIFENGDKLITGPILQTVLIDMIDDVNVKDQAILSKTGSWDEAVTQIPNLATKEEVTNLSESVARDLENVDLTGYATEQWVQNQGYLKEHQDISNLATKTELTEAENNLQGNITSLSESVARDLANVDVDLTGYATEQWVESKGYLTEHQDISNLATKTELNSVSESIQTDISGLATKVELNDTKNNLQGNITSLSESVARDIANVSVPEGVATEAWVQSQDYASKSYVDNAVSSSSVDLTGYATETWVQNQGYLKEHQDISNLATKGELNSVSESIQTDISNLSESVANSAVWKKGTGDDSIVQVIADGTYLPTATGRRAVATGYYTTASGGASHAEGEGTKALGAYDHAEGFGTTASGSHNHAEGQNTTASGRGSHAEGSNTIASAHCSHAEGGDTKASGSYSHAEGIYTEASGQASHAEGFRTTASKEGSHAEGESTIASGSYSHAEGGYTTTSNQYEHAQGQYNHNSTNQIFSVGAGEKIGETVTRRNAVSILEVPNSETQVVTASVFVQNVGGYDGTNPTPGTNDLATVINGLSSGGGSSETLWEKGTGTDSIVQVIADGTDQPIATGERAIATGYQTKASGQRSHAEGAWTSTSGYGSHAEGISTVAKSYGSHAEGRGTTTSGQYSHTEGGYTTATGQYSHAEGDTSNASGESSHAEGYHTSASNDYEHAQGRYNHSSTNQIFSIGTGNSDTDRRNAVSVLEVDNSGSYTASFFVQNIGGYDGTNPEPGTNDLATVINNLPSGGGSSETLWKKGEGQDSIVQAIASETDQPTATGDRATATGFSTKASGYISHAEGDYVEASGWGSHAEGHGTNASGEYSHAEGKFTIASNESEHAQGRYNHSSENQIFSIGTGNNYNDRRNAVSVLEVSNNNSYTSSFFVQNIGGYDGTNPEPGTNDLATVINGMSSGGGSSETLWKKGTGQDSVVQVLTEDRYNPRASGLGAVAIGDYSHAEGNYSHAEGEGSHAGEAYSHAEGYSVNTNGQYSHAEGYLTTAAGKASHAEGYNTSASNAYEHAQGINNHSSANQIFSVGAGDSIKDPNTQVVTETRRNAISVLSVPNSETQINTASVFVQNVGGYDGTNPLPGTNDLATVINNLPSGGTSSETWTFTLEDGSTVTKNIVMR